MAKVRKVTPVEKVSLDVDGIFSEAIQMQAHEAPQPVHLRRAAEALGVELHEVPVVENVAELIVFVLSVRASAGNEVATKEFLDRFSPKAARGMAVDVNVDSQAGPVASQNADEQAAADDYVSSLRLIQ